MYCVHHLANAKLGCPAFEALQKNGDKNFVPGLSRKMVAGSMNMIAGRLLSQLQPCNPSQGYNIAGTEIGTVSKRNKSVLPKNTSDPGQGSNPDCLFNLEGSALTTRNLAAAPTHVHVYVAGQNEIQVKMILTSFDSQFPLSSNPN